MVLLNCIHSRYTALLFFHSVPKEVPRPHLTLSLLYPAKSLIQQLMEDNQCPSHLSLSSSLLLISSLKGDQLVHFFHGNIAEASLLQILILQGNFLDGCAVEYSLRKQSLWCFLWFFCCRHTVYSSVCPFGQPLSSCLCSFALVYLLCYIWPAALFSRRLSEPLFNQRLVFTGYRRLNLNCKQTHLTVEVCNMISNPH